MPQPADRRPPIMAAVALAALAASIVATPAHAQNRSGDIVVRGTPDVAQATAEIARTPGGVAIVPDTAFKNTPVQTIKDILDYVPGVITQMRMGDDVRLSIRGSGLSRAYGARGVSLFVDGVPMNTSDGLLDFFEVDPSAYRYVEVYRGANALRYGSNALGGAINLVTPTGLDVSRLDARVDVGSFGYAKGQLAAGGTAGALDYFATASGQRIDGYREHSGGDQFRGNLNVGYQFSPQLQTRFYVTAASTDQRIPGEVSKAQALATPRSANPVWIVQDQQRNVDSIRVSNKTTLRLGEATIELGGFYNNRHVKHPIFQWLDFTVDDYGGFVRAVDDRSLGGIRNRLIAGAMVHNGTIDTEQFVNLPGAVKGPLASSYVDRSTNLSFYAEDSLYLRPDLAVIAGVQYLHARRDRRDRFLGNGDQSGARSYDLWSPRAGVLWDATPGTQVFANISRSAEVPTYDANSFGTPASSNLSAQRATTYEIGTRGRRGPVGWDIAVYRAEIRNELQCLTTGPFSACSVINAGRTVHQGIEAGLDAAVPLAPGGEALVLTTAYTYNDFFFDNDPLYGDNRLPGVPTHYVRAELLYKHPGGAYIGPNLEWSPKSYFADNANSLTVDSFALLNLKLGYEAVRWSAYVEGRNLTGKHYISTVAVAGTADPGSELFNPGPGRAVFGGVRYKW
ncbi:MAG: TonB-dependent receptor [Novosphingobium sp.]